MKNKKILKKLFLLTLCIVCLISVIQAYEYIPKNTEQNPFANTKQQTAQLNNQQNNVQKQEKISPENREITNLSEYFQYLPYAVNRHWAPYKANSDYEVTVQFRVHNNGSISDVEITDSTNEKANTSVLNAVKQGSPYKPLPKSYPSDTVKAQVILEYHK